METIKFYVPGTCRPAGSKTPRYANGHSWVTDACKYTKSWQSDVKLAAMQAYRRKLLDVALTASFTFYIVRPKNHFGSGKNATKLKLSAPAHPTVKPDLLKLARAIEDALTGVIYRDDALICHESLHKHYAAYAKQPGVMIEIYPS